MAMASECCSRLSASAISATFSSSASSLIAPPVDDRVRYFGLVGMLDEVAAALDVFEADAALTVSLLGATAVPVLPLPPPLVTSAKALRFGRAPATALLAADYAS
jgi:hypothetical protein